MRDTLSCALYGWYKIGRYVGKVTVWLSQLHIAAANGYVQVMEFLLCHGVSVDPVDCESWQPIHCAACWGQVSLLCSCH